MKIARFGCNYFKYSSLHQFFNTFLWIFLARKCVVWIQLNTIAKESGWTNTYYLPNDIYAPGIKAHQITTISNGCRPVRTVPNYMRKFSGCHIAENRKKHFPLWHPWFGYTWLVCWIYSSYYEVQNGNTWKKRSLLHLHCKQNLHFDRGWLFKFTW